MTTVNEADLHEMPELSFSTSAAALRPVFEAATQHALRLHAERSAAPAAYNASLLEHNIDETIDRIRAGRVTDTWWQSLLSVIGHKYVAPDFIKVQAIQEWLSQEDVVRGFKRLATDFIMGLHAERDEIREHLAAEYSKYTGENRRLAIGPIEVVTGILVAGYLSSIPSNQRPLAGMLQQVHGSLNERIQHLEKKQDDALAELLPERRSIMQQLSTQYVEKELREILSLRALDQITAKHRIMQLFKRITEGDLSTIQESIKQKVRCWTARLCATQKDTLPFAKEIRARLAEINPSINLSIIDALILENDGHGQAALRSLRDAKDRDSRSVWFGILTRVRGEERALEWFDEMRPENLQDFFSGAGWSGWAVASAKCGRWQNAADVLIVLQNLWDEMPALPIIEGSVNAALLLPDDFRFRVLDGAPLYRGIAPMPGVGAEHYYSRAIECFNYAARRLRDQANEAWLRAIADWSLWLRLMDPDAVRRAAAREHVRAEMQEGAKATMLAPFAYSFEIDYDPSILRTYFDQRRELGGLDDRDRVAEFIVNAQFSKPSEFVEYVNKNSDKLLGVVPPEFVISRHVESLLDSENSSDGARNAIKQYRASIDEHHARRLEMMVDAYEGADVRTKLMELFETTGSIVDLRNLIAFLRRAKDREALRPLCKELYRRTPTAACAMDVIASLSDPTSYDSDEIIAFLNENHHLLEQRQEFCDAKSSALYHSGRYAEAKSINERSKRKRLTPANLRLGLGIAVASGNWEEIGRELNEAWALREQHDAHALLSLAYFAGQYRETRDRAIDLLKLAAKKAPEDPSVLAVVYWQHFYLDHDDGADPELLARAMELSDDEGGPIWKISLPDIAEEWLPKRRAHLIEIEEKCAQGEIPITVAAGAFNVPLSRMLIDAPAKNAEISDGRRRAALPIAAAGRPVLQVGEDWTVGIDLTAVLVLQYLGILKEVLNSFSHCKFPPDIFEHLFRERIEARFHQPSRVVAAGKLLGLHGRDSIEILDIERRPPRWLIDEAGIETAEVLQWAKVSGGISVCAGPIYRAGSLMEEEADVGEFRGVIVSLASFARWLNETGQIGSEVYGRICTVLRHSSDMDDTSISPDFADSPICLDRLAVQYLSDVNALSEVVSAVGVVLIHNSVFVEMRALANEGESEAVILSNIDHVRHTLTSSVQNGKASFLPRSATADRKAAGGHYRFATTASLLERSEVCDAVYIDDRFMNRHSTFVGPDKNPKPIITSLDALRHLAKVGRMTQLAYFRARHNLRAGGFAFIPLEAEEISHWLHGTSVDEEGRFTESKELRVLRQAAARDDALALTNWQEVFALASNSRSASSEALGTVWAQQDSAPEVVLAQATWIWRNLMAATVPGGDLLAHAAYRKLVSDIIALRIGGLLIPLAARSPRVQQLYTQWLEETVLRPLWPANSDRIRAALMASKAAIESLDIDQAAYGNLFLEQLPERARRFLIREDPKFAEQCGYRAERVFSFGQDLQISGQSLFKAAVKVLSEGREETILGVSGEKASMRSAEDGDGVSLRWHDEKGTPHEVSIADLCLLSPKQAVRQKKFEDIVARLGPTFARADQLREEIRWERPNFGALSSVFDASANGVAALQRRVATKIRGGQPLGRQDLVPDSMAYFEQLVGPLPTGEIAGSYIKGVLLQYRQALVGRELKGGLHICCLGALHDDLSPGRWLDDVDNDSLWSAMLGANPIFSPISLLGALDVALYRQDDARFRDFGSRAVARLLDNNFGVTKDIDVYRVLQICGDLVLNGINLLDGGATTSGYWKQLAAWMQAGYIVETMLKSTHAVRMEEFEGWAYENMAAAGAYASLIDAKVEPMLLATRMMGRSWRFEVIGRLEVMRQRHEACGRKVPGASGIDRLLGELDKSGLTPAIRLAGPLEGDMRPTGLMPNEIGSEIERIGAERENNLLSFLLILSQLFSLNEQQLQRARAAVDAAVEETQEKGTDEILTDLEHASVIAAGSGSTSLSDSIGDAMVRIAPVVSVEDVENIPRILLQAAAAFGDEEEWSAWLDRKLTDVVGQLPSHPNLALRAVLGHLEEIEIVLPTERWFHSRAKARALSGVF